MDFKTIQKYKKYLSKQEYKTVLGQFKSNNAYGAYKGLKKILRRQGIELKEVY